MPETVSPDFKEHSPLLRCGLRPGDIGAITELHGRLYHQEYDYNVGFEAYVAKGLYDFYKDNDPERSRIWIAELDGKIVGSLAVQGDGDLARIRFVLVAPEARGMGLAKHMMDLALQFKEAKGYAGIYLWTTEELHPAIAMYKKYGFELTEEHESFDFGKRVVEQRYDLR